MTENRGPESEIRNQTNNKENNMKRFAIVPIILTCMAVVSSPAQIPNAGFETWVSGNPSDWNTSNIQGTVVNITQSGVSHSGSSALSGVVADFSGFSWPPVIISGANAEGFPVSVRHEAVHGWYQCDLLGVDVFTVFVVMVQGDSAVGGGSATITTSTSVYTELVADILYFYPVVPDTCIIYASISGSGGGLPEVGSSFLLDDLSFGPLSAVDQSGNTIPEQYSLLQNYPNPFNPSTTIEYAIPQAGHVRLTVFDMTGREVSRLVDEEQGPGMHRVGFDGSNLSSGVYFYRLESGGFVRTRNLVVLK